MFKVLLINPFCTISERGNRLYPAEPLGLLYIATYLARECKLQGIPMEIKVLDAQLEGPDECYQTSRGFRHGMTDDQIRAYVSGYRPDVTGVGMNYTFGAKNSVDVATLTKEAWPQTHLVIGGAHATLAHCQVAEHAPVDAVVHGEGELTFTEICFSLARGGGFENINGVTYRKNGKVIENPARAPIPDLDSLPIPDRSFVPYATYLTKPQYIHTMQKPVGTVFTSRGCPFRCVFCSTQKTWGNTWRGRSPQSMLEEVLYLRDTYGVREIAFQDDQFLGNRQRILDFCKLVVETKPGMTFIVPPGNSPAFMTPELLDWMARAGFYRLSFSVDTGTDSAVRYARKPVNLSNVRPLVAAANHRGLWTYGTFVIGFPFEKKEDIQATVNYAYGLKLDFLRFYIAQPHFGSELYDRYLAEGRLAGLDLNDQHSPMDAFIGTDHMTPEELIELRNKAEGNYFKHHMRDFLNPKYVLREFFPKIASFRRLRYFLGLLMELKTIVVKFKKVEHDVKEP